MQKTVIGVEFSTRKWTDSRPVEFANVEVENAELRCRYVQANNIIRSRKPLKTGAWQEWEFITVFTNPLGDNSLVADFFVLREDDCPRKRSDT